MPAAPLITRKELAELLAVSEKTVDVWRRHGRIPALKIGRVVRFSFDDVMEALRHAGEEKPVARSYAKPRLLPGLTDREITSLLIGRAL